jgi:hypothetical protein
VLAVEALFEVLEGGRIASDPAALVAL